MFIKKKNHVVRLDDRKMEERPPFIRDRRSLIIAMTLMLLVIILCIRYPGPSTVAERIFQWVGLPIHSGDNGMGFHYANIGVLLILIVLFFVLDRALNRGLFVAFILIMMLLNNAPGWVTTTYQRLFASGVYAVEVDRDQVSCHYVLEKKKYTGTCQITLTNYSGKDVEITPVIEVPIFIGEPLTNLPDIRLSSLGLPPHSKEIYGVKFDYNIDHSENMSGTIGSGLIITLSDGVRERRWE